MSSVQESSDDEDDQDDQDDDLITPYISISKYNHPRITPCWSLCADLCNSFKEIGKVPASGHWGLKSKISERMLFKLCNAQPYAQNLRRIKQRKERCFIQESGADQDDQDDEMIFSYCRLLHQLVSFS